MSIRRQCALLGLNRSSLFYTPHEPMSKAPAFDEAIMARIDFWHTRCPYLGSRKLVTRLQEDGVQVCRKTVRRLMQKMGIYAVYPKPNLSKRNFKEAIVPYLLRNYTASFPNQVWSIDITYIPMPHGHMYLTAIIDWHSRRIVGHHLSDSLEVSNVVQAVRETVEKYGIPAIINSDQGSQFTSKEYKGGCCTYLQRVAAPFSLQLKLPLSRTYTVPIKLHISRDKFTQAACNRRFIGAGSFDRKSL